MTDGQPHTQVIAMSDTDQRGLVMSAFASGATGYLVRDADDAEIAHILRSLATGIVLDPRVAGHLLATLAETFAQSSADLRAQDDFSACRKLELRPRTQATAEGTRHDLPD